MTLRQRAAAYLHRFITHWVAEDPAPTYSLLDRIDGKSPAPAESLDVHADRAIAITRDA